MALRNRSAEARRHCAGRYHTPATPRNKSRAAKLAAAVETQRVGEEFSPEWFGGFCRIQCWVAEKQNERVPEGRPSHTPLDQTPEISRNAAKFVTLPL